MAISTLDGLLDALGNLSSRLVIDKASIANATSGGFMSLWRATGTPGQAAIPTTSAIPTKALLGAMGFTNQTPPVTSYLAYMYLTSGNSATTVEIHDRLAHMGGLVLNSTSSQTTNLPCDLSTLGIDADRRGDSNYSDVLWWLEVYTDGGATASNATINVTYNDGSTGNLAVIAVGGTLRAGRMLPLIPAVAGRFIRGINSVILSASTGTAGNFGFTATRNRSTIPLSLANRAETFKWDQLGLPNIVNDSCLQMIVIPTTTTTGTLRGGGKVAHG